MPTRDIHMNQIGHEAHWLQYLKAYVAPLATKVFMGYYSGVSTCCYVTAPAYAIWGHQGLPPPPYPSPTPHLLPYQDIWHQKKKKKKKKIFGTILTISSYQQYGPYEGFYKCISKIAITNIFFYPEWSYLAYL